MSDEVAEFNSELERLDKAMASLDAQLERLYGVHDDDLAGGLHRRGSLASLAAAAGQAADEVAWLAAAVGAVAGKLGRAAKEASA